MVDQLYNPMADYELGKLTSKDKAKKDAAAAANPYQGLYDSLDPDTQAQVAAHAKALGMTVVQYMPFLAGKMGLNGSGGGFTSTPAGQNVMEQSQLANGGANLADGYGAGGSLGPMNMGFSGPNGEAPPSTPAPPVTPQPGDPASGGPGNRDAAGTLDSQAAQAADTGGGSTTPPADTPSAAPPVNPADTGFSASFDQNDFDDLANDPGELFRQWAMQQGLDPDSTAPRMQAMKRAAMRSKGVYQLLNGGDNNALGEAANNPDFIDFFNDYMKNGTTAGAAPMLTIQQAQTMLQQALRAANTNPDDKNNLWSNLLMGSAGTDLTTGVDYSPKLSDQSRAISNLLLSVLGGIIDPSILQGIQNRTDRQAAQFNSGSFDGSIPKDQRYLDWLEKSGGGLTGNAGQ